MIQIITDECTFCKDFLDVDLEKFQKDIIKKGGKIIMVSTKRKQDIMIEDCEIEKIKDCTTGSDDLWKDLKQ